MYLLKQWTSWNKLEPTETSNHLERAGTNQNELERDEARKD